MLKHLQTWLLPLSPQGSHTSSPTSSRSLFTPYSRLDCPGTATTVPPNCTGLGSSSPTAGVLPTHAPSKGVPSVCRKIAVSNQLPRIHPTQPNLGQPHQLPMSLSLWPSAKVPGGGLRCFSSLRQCPNVSPYFLNALSACTAKCLLLLTHTLC